MFCGLFLCRAPIGGSHCVISPCARFRLFCVRAHCLFDFTRMRADERPTMQCTHTPGCRHLLSCSRSGAPLLQVRASGVAHRCVRVDPGGVQQAGDDRQSPLGMRALLPFLLTDMGRFRGSSTDSSQREHSTLICSGLIPIPLRRLRVSPRVWYIVLGQRVGTVSCV